MGWRDRDYARFTAEERRLLLGSGTAHRTRRVGFNPTALLAVLVSGALLALGQFPRGHPLVPTLHFSLPGIGHHAAKPRTFPLNGPSTASVGSTLTLRGSSSSAVSGAVTVTGSYGDGWKTLVTTVMRSGTYQAQVKLWRRGLLHLRVTYPDGSRAVGSISVR
jgi:hypothetical protein